jgi:diacylglycerol diphosphate phosphatase/phosphatidate phosphatase
MPFFDTLAIDRNHLGLDRFSWYEFFLKWKLADAFYAILMYILDFIYFEKIQPFQRQFFINDITLSHPFAEHERVPAELLLFWIIVLPLIIIPTFTIILTPKPFKFYVMYLSLLGVFISMGTCIFVTDVLKNWTGRCRPDFLARCVPKENLLSNVLYTAKQVCTTTDKAKLLDGFRTTPSGHSSMSWSSFGYISLWLNGQLNSSHVHQGAWRSILAFLPCLLAFYVALSRTQDYRHHFIDIVLGSSLGSFIAWWSYRRYFPEISSKACYIPYVLLENIEREENIGDLGTISNHDYYKDIQLSTISYTSTRTGPEEVDLESNSLRS